MIKNIIPIMILFLMGGCLSMSDSYCQIYEPIRYSEKDTRETIRQIDINNAEYEEVCL